MGQDNKTNDGFMQMNNKIYIADEPEYFGVMPVKQEINVLPSDDDIIVITSRDKIKQNRVIGFNVKETIGIGVINPRGLLQAEIIIGKNNE